ncbi:MAG: hypothetical protein C0605_00870 [Hyphomicrobiales bacterium]|nr:MAG: hypothetical protein C0605_00870 [Hyphomicrobiales bacterium]
MVASEVKNLANQTARATEDITQRIVSLREGMAGIQQTMQASTAAVDEGESAIREAMEEMVRITDQVGSVSGRMSEISGILSQQQGASAEIAESISNVASKAGESDELVTSISDIMHVNVAGFAKSAAQMFDEGSPISRCAT